MGCERKVISRVVQQLTVGQVQHWLPLMSDSITTIHLKLAQQLKNANYKHSEPGKKEKATELSFFITISGCWQP